MDNRSVRAGFAAADMGDLHSDEAKELAVLRRELSERTRHQRILNHLSQAALSDTPLPALFRQVLEQVQKALDVPYCRLLERTSEGGWVLRGKSGEADLPEWNVLPAEYGGLATFAYTNQQMVVMSERSGETRFEAGPDYQSIVSAVAVLIPGGIPLFGVLEVADTAPRTFQPHEIDFLKTLANALGVVIERNRLDAKVQETDERMRGLLADVADLRDASLRAEESEIRFRTMADAVPVFIGLTDPEGQAIYYNKTCQTFAGESSEELVAKNWLRYVHPDDRQKLLDIFTEAIPHRKAFVFEYRIVGPDGDIRYLMNNGVPRFQSNGEFLGYVLLGIDITEERKYSDRFQRVVESNLMGVVYSGFDGQIFECNNAFLNLLGYSRAEIETRRLNFFDFTPPEFFGITRQALLEVEATGASRPFEKQYFHKDGHRVDVLITRVGLGPDSPDEAISVIFDISSRKQAERALKESLARERLNRNVLEIINQSSEPEPMVKAIADVIGPHFKAERCLLIYHVPSSEKNSRASTRMIYQYLSAPDIEPFTLESFSVELQTLLCRLLPDSVPFYAEKTLNEETYFQALLDCFRKHGVSEPEITRYHTEMRDVWHHHYHIRSFARLNIVYRGKTYGSIALHHGSESDQWNETDLELLGDVAVNIGAALSQIELRQQEQVAKQELEKSYNLINIISEAQARFITNPGDQGLFSNLLNRLLAYADSEYGFISEILIDSEGQPYLKTRSITDISWNEEVRRFYLQHVATGLEFHNLSSLFGHVITSGQPVISNDPTRDPRRGGLPKGHPPLNAFMGLPVYKGHEMVGMVGIANRPGGYDEVLAEELRPFLLACANIIAGVRSEALREHLTRELTLSEQTLKDYAERLKRSNDELEQFATIASHDLQAPLRKVILFSDYLETSLGGTLPDESRDYLERMQKATRKMQTLITDLLALSRVNRRGKPFIPVDLGETIVEVISYFEEVIGISGAQVTVGEMMTIDADPTQMHQVFQNLLGNALKFRRPDVPPVIEISATATPDQHCEIRVTDNGIGFDEKYLDRIFTVFERLHGESTFEGTGMGLAIVRKIAERHHGEITAHSTPGQGSTFIVTLPIHQG